MVPVRILKLLYKCRTATKDIAATSLQYWVPVQNRVVDSWYRVPGTSYIRTYYVLNTGESDQRPLPEQFSVRITGTAVRKPLAVTTPRPLPAGPAANPQGPALLQTPATKRAIRESEWNNQACVQLVTIRTADNLFVVGAAQHFGPCQELMTL